MHAHLWEINIYASVRRAVFRLIKNVNPEIANGRSIERYRERGDCKSIF